MKINKIAKFAKSTIAAALVLFTIATPMTSMAYSANQVSALNNSKQSAITMSFENIAPKQVYLNGELTSLQGKTNGGRTYLPVRAISELLDSEVNYQPDGNKHLIQITKEQKEILLKLGVNKMFLDENNMVYVDDSNIKTTPATNNGVTYLPLRAVAEALGVNVDYSNGKVLITTDGTTPIAPPVTPPIEEQQPPVVEQAGFEQKSTSSETVLLDGRVVIPSGLNYRAPKGINPGDTLTVEQIKQYAPGYVKDIEYFKEDLSTKKVIFTPAGSTISISSNKDAKYYNTFAKGVSGHRLVTTPDSKRPNAIISTSGTVFFSDGTNKGLAAGSLQETLKADKLSKMDYSIITDEGYVREGNIVFLTFY